MDLVEIFYAANFHPQESYVVVKGEKASFTLEEINELYDLLNDPEAYSNQRIIDSSMRSDAKKVNQLIARLRAKWTKTPIERLQQFLHQLTTKAKV